MKTAILTALEELDGELYEKFAPVREKTPLHIIGGAALLLQDTRKAMNGKVTDVDYLGREFDPQVKAVVDRVGMKHGLGRSFLCNELGSDALEHLEYCVGRLTFVPFAAMKYFDVHVLCEKDILRLKVYALDTCIMARRDDDVTEFERAQDYADIRDIAEKNGIAPCEIEEMTRDYVICQKEVYSSIADYMANGRNRYVDDRLPPA